MIEKALSMSLRFFRNIILLTVLAGAAYYLLQRYHIIPSQNDESDVAVFNPDDEASDLPGESGDDALPAKPVLQAFLPGSDLPQQISSLDGGSTLDLTSGLAAVYHPSSMDPSQAATRWELSAEEEHISVSKRAEGLYAITLISSNSGENRTLALLRVDGVTLRSIEDDQGEPVALLLPLTAKKQVLLMPGMRRALPLSTEGLPTSDLPEELPKSARVSTDMLRSTEFELRFVSPQKLEPLSNALHGKASFALPDALHLPALVVKNNLLLKRKPGASPLPGLDLQLPFNGRATGLITLFSPKLTLDWDFRDEVLAHVMRVANEPHGAKGKAPTIRRNYSIAHVYHLISHIPTATSAKEKNKLAEEYFELFLDPEFRSFCEERMTYFPIPDPTSISKEGGKLVIQGGALRQLLRFDVRSLQSSMNDVLTRAAQEAYTTCRKRFCAMPLPPLVVRLVDVLVSPDSDEEQISWTFTLETL